jgi:hypothetical protein
MGSTKDRVLFSLQFLVEPEGSCAGISYPAARLEPGFPFDCLGFFPTRTDMGGKAEVVEDIAYFLVIVSFIQAHPLRLCLCRFGSVYHNP